jgi:hypothetical protein
MKDRSGQPTHSSGVDGDVIRCPYCRRRCIKELDALDLSDGETACVVCPKCQAPIKIKRLERWTAKVDP